MTIVEEDNGGQVTGEDDLSKAKSEGPSLELQASVEVSVDGFVDDKMNSSGNGDAENATGGKNDVKAASDDGKSSGHGAHSHTIVSGTSSTEYGVAVDEIQSSTANGTGSSKKEDAAPLKVNKHLISTDTEFSVATSDLSELANERTRLALAQLLDIGAKREEEKRVGNEDEEAPSTAQSTWAELRKTAQSIRDIGEGSDKEAISMAQKAAVDKAAEVGAAYVVNVLLKSSTQSGIDASEVAKRKELFGSNAIADKELDSFLQLCWEAVQDFVLVMLIVLGLITIVIETVLHEDEEETNATQSQFAWAEGAAILITVGFVVLLTAGIDYAKQFAFVRLTRSLNETNTKSVIRNGKQVSVVDDDIVVGDIVSVNSHNLASIPADCILLGPSTDLVMDESTLTGESVQIRKKPGDIILSGTTAVQGSGKMAVIAVGINSVSGKIQARVYESRDHEDDLDGDENSPLFVKLDLLAKQIGLAGTVAACIAFVASSLIGLLLKDDPTSELVKYMTVAITVLAVAVPEGLPLAVTLALAFSSNKMMSEQNLVKHLDACETMGCATTICTDKTGTLTANKMTARAFYVVGKNYVVTDPAVTLSKYMMDNNISQDVVDIISTIIAIDTMNETVLTIGADGQLESSQGNPTETALLIMVHQFGMNYEKIRNTTAGRSSIDDLANRLSEGKQFEFTSARKMMSWAVPMDGGGHRVYIKGAQEVLVGRSSRYLDEHGREQDVDDSVRTDFIDIGVTYSRRGMRCLALAYRDLEQGADLEELSTTVTNSDGTDAFVAETDVVIVGLVGIEDPLRAEVPHAIEQCYEAGIDVRMVTGDNANTAVSIAYQAGILRDSHFAAEEKVAMNLKEHVLMEGKEFRKRVYRINDDGTKDFDQAAFDRIWPFLRVLARSSPDDKLTLAHGLNQSTLFTDEKVVETMLREHDIVIFPDRQVVAMTGDGTNDAPALKRSDIGFAMGISGTQIAKDAADIILLDDNFASIVTAAKWGRNVYDSIQKFLQFQLTVNIAAVVTALVGAFFYQTSPLAAIQLLWVNLLMDSLASLALASEPPVDELLKRPPVNRTEHMITYRMWANMLGQAMYQIVVIMVLLFMGPDLLNIEKGHVEEDDGINSTHYTLIFNAFVWMQLFNEINCRNLKGQFNVFDGMFNNLLFCGIVFTTAVMQVLIVQYGSYALSVHVDGLSFNHWLLSIGIGAGSLPVQQVINLVYLMGKGYKKWRMKPRVQKSGVMSTRSANGSHLHSE